MPEFDTSFAGAFGAGLLSFLSPCILPLVPPYLCFLGGLTLDQLAEEQQTGSAASRRVFYAALAFVLGFATVFVMLGAVASALGQLIAENLQVLSYVAGTIIIILGLHFIGLFRIKLLYREARFHVAKRPVGLIGAFIVGLAFAFGWTPCVGPVLAAILLVASSEDSLFYGVALLGSYAAGIGLPFLAAAFAAGPFSKFMVRFRRYLPFVEKTMGGLLVITGILFYTGGITDISFWLLETFPALQVG